MPDIRKIKKTITDEDLTGTDEQILQKLYTENIKETFPTAVTETLVLKEYGSDLDDAVNFLDKLRSISNSDPSIKYMIGIFDRGGAINFDDSRFKTKMTSLVNSNVITQDESNKLKAITERNISLVERDQLGTVTKRLIAKTRTL